MCDLFSILRNIEFVSYVDDTSQVIGRNANKAIESLEHASIDLMEWFSNIKLKTIPGEYHLLTGSNDELKICINDDAIHSPKCEKL